MRKNSHDQKIQRAIIKQNYITPTRIELIFTALGEESTRIVTTNANAQGFEENREAALKGGTIAGNARLNLERVSNEQVVSPNNYLDLVESNQPIPPLLDANKKTDG